MSHDLLIGHEKDAEWATRIPISVYILWHPQLVEGPALAAEVHHWLGGTDDARALGLGLPVHFRSASWTADLELERRSDRAPEPAAAGDPIAAARTQELRQRRRPIDIGHALHNVFVPLVDDNMVNDPSWRRDLLEIAKLHYEGRDEDGKPIDIGEDKPRVHLAPVQLSRAWSRLPAAVTRVKALYLDRWADNQDEPDDARLARWRGRLRRLLTQALVRLLREHDTAASLLPTEVFLSHAKMDLDLGPGVAERLRDVAAGYGQIEVFYDENDLPMGHSWMSRMLTSAGSGAGFVAVLSDHYATRYWCRREVEQARTPRRALEPGASGPAPDEPYHHIWAVRPSVVAVTLRDSWSRLVSDLSTAPAIAWDNDRAAEVLDRLFREAIIAEFQLHYAALLFRRLRAVVQQRVIPVAFVTWTPDAASLLRLARASDGLWQQGALIAYPGHGFLPREEEELRGFFSDAVKLVSYEELADAICKQSGAVGEWQQLFATPGNASDSGYERWPAVALSAGDADDLAALGYDAPPKGSEQDSLHVDVAVLRICRALLQARVRIAYGGMLRKGPSFTSLLHDAVAATFPTANLDNPAPDPATPLENYIPWPFGRYTDVATRARLHGLCRHYDILPPDNPAQPAAPGAAAPAWYTASALAEMRKIVASRTVATVALAGKSYGAAGIMPGVAEEVLVATMQAVQPDGGTVGPAVLEELQPTHVRVVLLGAFGGIVRQIVRYLLGACADLPAALTLAGQLEHADSEGLRRAMAGKPGSDGEAYAKERYELLAACLTGLRRVAQLDQSTELPLLGITVCEWRGLMQTDSPGWMRRVLKDRVAPALR